MNNTLGDPRWPDDFWIPSTPESAGLDGARLEAAVGAIEQRELPIHAFLVIRRGRLVLERYGTDAGRQVSPDDLQELYSVTKTVIASLVGMAIAERRLAGVEAGVVEHFREGELGDRSSGKERITLEHLLTMRSGLAPPDWSPGESARFQEAPCSAAWWLSRPMVAEPGASFCYSNGDSQLLAEILRRATGVDPGAWARERILGPLGIGRVRWDTDPSGTAFGGFGLWLRPRDLARFGWLLASGGRWRGEQLVPEGWIAAATTARVDTGSPAGRYAYQCWVPSVGGFALRGLMGQSVYAFPERQLVVVFNARLEPAQAEIILDQLVAEHVLAAVQR